MARLLTLYPTPHIWLLCYNAWMVGVISVKEQESPQASTLRILAVADHVEPQLYSTTLADWLSPVNLLISCGDLPPYYLDFLMTNLGAPLVHVLGNHCSAQHNAQKQCDPEAYPGASNLNRRVQAIRVGDKMPRLLVAGLEGSPWYNNGPHQYTESQVALNLASIAPRLLLNKLLTGRYLDILIAHTPPRGIHDNPDKPHLGFTSLLPFLDRFKPALLLHGHTHHYDPALPARTRYKQTEVINAYGHVLLELVNIKDKAGWHLKPLVRPAKRSGESAGRAQVTAGGEIGPWKLQ